MPTDPTPDPNTPITDRRRPSFLREYFAVIIVFSAFVLLLSVYMIEIHWSGDSTVTTWLQNKMSDLLSAMLMGLTGAAAGAKLINGAGK